MRRLARQRGVAVVTALLLTTLAVTIVASLFWQQQVQVRSMENQRLQLQTRWILRGALDWARLVLRQDAADHQLVTALDHVWNTPLAETRLDQYIERERVEGETFDATLSGRIIDATSRYNLTNLANNRVQDPSQLKVYRKLLENLRLDPVLATRTAEAIAASQALAPPPPSGQGGQGGSGQVPGQAQPAPKDKGRPMALVTLDDLLSIQGYTPAIVDQLREFVIVLPERAKVNVNTAPAEVLAAVIGFSVGEGSALVARRKTAHFKDIADFESATGGRGVDTTTYDVKSEFFLVESQVRLDRAALSARALIHRKISPPRVDLVSIRQD